MVIRSPEVLSSSFMQGSQLKSFMVYYSLIGFFLQSKKLLVEMLHHFEAKSFAKDC